MRAAVGRRAGPPDPAAAALARAGARVHPRRRVRRGDAEVDPAAQGRALGVEAPDRGFARQARARDRLTPGQPAGTPRRRAGSGRSSPLPAWTRPKPRPGRSESSLPRPFPGLALLELERRGVDAVPEARRPRPVGEHVPEMAAAARAHHLGAHHPVARRPSPRRSRPRSRAPRTRASRSRSRTSRRTRRARLRSRRSGSCPARRHGRTRP